MPEWVPHPEWNGFKAMRTKIKKPLTERAIGMAVRKLERLRDEGQDPAAVLDQSTLHCWQDLYPVKDGRGGSDYGDGELFTPAGMPC